MTDLNIIKNRKVKNDVFFTPQTVVDIHLKIVQPLVDENDIILDPFYGQGAYYNSYSKYFNKNNKFDYTEITLNKDFYDYNEKIDVIVSNPPFSQFNKVIDHCIKLKPHTISLIFGILNISARRMSVFNKAGYFIYSYHLVNVKGWFGNSILITFTNKVKSNCISFDETLHKN